MSLARAFAETANAVEDAMLLVTPTGKVVAANQAAIAAFGVGSSPVPLQLGDLAAEEPLRLVELLPRRHAGSCPKPRPAG